MKKKEIFFTVNFFTLCKKQTFFFTVKLIKCEKNRNLRFLHGVKFMCEKNRNLRFFRR